MNLIEFKVIQSVMNNDRHLVVTTAGIVWIKYVPNYNFFIHNNLSQILFYFKLISYNSCKIK